MADFSASARTAVRTWAESPAWSLYIEGGVGTRKSSLAAAVVHAARAAGHRASFVTLPAAVERIRQFCDWWMEQAKGVELLVIDDLAAGRDTAHVHEQLAAILYHRYDHCRRTIVTSNLPLEDLARTFDARLADRLREGHRLCLGAASRRIDGGRPQ